MAGAVAVRRVADWLPLPRNPPRGARAMAVQMGHATEAMSDHYVRESFGDHAAAVGRLADWVIEGKVQ